MCNPAPFPTMSFLSLFRKGIENMEAGEKVLDMGTGCGIWALLAAREGATVTGVDIIPEHLYWATQNARENDLDNVEFNHSDLFTSLKERRFDRIFFNPPFHIGTPSSRHEYSYLGGADGDIVRQFLEQLPHHLKPGGRAFLILPDLESTFYRAQLEIYQVRISATQWVPVMGKARCYEIKVK